MFQESSISLVKEFGGFFVQKGEPIPIQLPNRLVYRMRSVKNSIARMSVYMNVL